MSMALGALALRADALAFISTNNFKECLDSELIKRRAIRVEGASVVFDPRYMVDGRFYCVEIDHTPYLYRKVNETEIEIYGLAEKD